ncbi:MAG: CDP-diacylglycerol--glycerol-3-phosphate 3-phosphatidyltransferase [Myxococcota bacterium]|jgi:CDP-diacylglycerol--glycerol-3-phosphate 3-phosphatidyltransferase
MMGVRATFPAHVSRVTSPIGRALARTPLRPNHITTFGLLLTAVAAVLLGADRPVIAGWVLVAGGLMDTFDGALARASGSSTPYGAFYDSVTDRLSDGTILAGAAWWLRADDRLFALVLIALVAAQATSYVRAKAEAIDLDCSVGLIERTERAVLLMLGLVFHRWLLEPVLWILALGGAVTVLQRIHHVWCQIERDLPADLVELARGDRAWNRAFRSAARALFGEASLERAERLIADREAATAVAVESTTGGRP